jgi:hypothetical protein
VSDSDSKWIDLAKISQEEFKDRRALEWKLAFGFWTGIASFTYFVTGDKTLHLQPCVLTILYGLIGLVATCFWLFPLQRAHADNKAWWKYYLDRAEGYPPCIANKAGGSPTCTEQATKPLPCTCRPENWTIFKPFANWKTINSLWFIGQISFTLIFLVLSWFTVTQFRHEQPTKGDGTTANTTADSDKTASPRQ